jgi:hypothetical protein
MPGNAGLLTRDKQEARHSLPLAGPPTCTGLGLGYCRRRTPTTPLTTLSPACAAASTPAPPSCLRHPRRPPQACPSAPPPPHLLPEPAPSARRWQRAGLLSQHELAPPPLGRSPAPRQRPPTRRRSGGAALVADAHGAPRSLRGGPAACPPALPAPRLATLQGQTHTPTDVGNSAPLCGQAGQTLHTHQTARSTRQLPQRLSCCILSHSQVHHLIP